MQVIENGVLRLEYCYNHPEDVAHMIEQLKSSRALKYVHTIDASVRALCEYRELWDELKVFVRKTDKITNLSLYQSCTNKRAHNNISAIIKILCEFKRTANLKLVLRDVQYGINEIHQLRKYFDDQTTIKNLHLESNYYNIRCIMESNEFCESIETVDLTIADICDDVELIPISMTRKIKKMHFTNCKIRPDHMIEFNAFTERFLALNSTIDELDLYNVSLNTDTVRIISTFIKTHDLTTLSMHCCTINSKRIDILADALETSSVERLNLGNDCIEYEEAVSIANMLRVNPSLKFVTISNLGDKSMTYEGIIEILSTLATNSTVREFCCLTTIPVIGETLESVRQTFEQILMDNYTLICFVVLLEFELEGIVDIKLTNITDRNKKAFNESRFIKAKVANSADSW